MSELSPTMIRDLTALLREWRAGRLGPTRGLRRSPPAPLQSRFGPLFQVTAVDTGAGTCTVQRVDAAGNPVAGSELTGVLYDTAPSVGDSVQLCRRTDGSLCIFQGGGGTRVSADDTTPGNLYESGGKLRAGTHIGLTVGDPGADEYLTIAESGTRADHTQTLRVETRTSDPGSPQNGDLWLRTDL